MDYQIWKNKFEEIYKTYEVIDSYLKNKEAIQAHLKKLNYEERIKRNNPSDEYLATQKALPYITAIASLFEVERIDKPLTGMITELNTVYHETVQGEPLKFINEFSSQFAKQIIVMMYSHLYDCLKDYFKLVLKENPKILIGLINTGTEKKGLIPFSKVLEAKNLQSIVDEQINITSTQLVDGGKFTDVFKRIKQYSKIEIEGKTEQVIMEGHELRNKIVHEITNTKLVVEPSPKEIKESILAMLKKLEGNTDDSQKTISE